MAVSALAPDLTLGVRRSPRPSLLWAIVLSSLAAAGCTVLLALTSDHIREPGVHAGLQVWGMLGFILAGVVAWSRRPESRFGPLMVLAGAVWFLSSLASANLAVPFTVGIAFDLLPAVLFLHVFLTFPSGRVDGSFERALLVAGYFTAFAVQLVGMTLGGYGPDNLLEVVSQPDAQSWLPKVQLVVLSGLCVAGVGVLALRRRRAGKPTRRWLALLVDSFALGLLMIAFLFLSAVFGMVSGQLEFETVRRATFFVLGLAPLVFLVGMLDARLARSGVGDLMVGLRANPNPANLRQVLARAVRDPSLTLAYWLPEFGSYADHEGRPVELPSPGGRQAMTPIERDGVRVAALLHDPALADERELLDAVTAAAGIAIENGRLQAELKARLEELRGSRSRVIEAGQKERQRLERNLHDGAQQRLIALSLELSLLEEQLDGDQQASARLGVARREIAASLGELREVARGIHPAVVSGHGLEVALEQLVARAPVPIRLNVEVDDRLPEQLEVAAYYLVSESLANIGKYAQASSASIEVSRISGQLLVEVVDDGVGGADTERGSGLRGLADRVEALGGRLRVWSPVGGGTRVRAEIPCAP